MGGDLKVIGKSSNIDIQMESSLVYIIKNALDNKKGGDFIAEKCKELCGGSWIIINSSPGKGGSFDMFFAFTSLKWIKFKKGLFTSIYLFQISS